VLLAVFNVFDTVGRYFAGTALAAPLGKVNTLPVFVGLRLVFIAGFLACAKRIGGAASGDATVLILAAAFAFTNGSSASLAFIHAPSLPGLSAVDRRNTGMLLSLSLNLGIVTGSNAALAFSSLPSYAS
jgi:hypothetical protein